MTDTSEPVCTAVLASGGLDSCILIGDTLRSGGLVQPLYVRTGLVWQQRELPALEAYLTAIKHPRLSKLVTLDLPLADLYTGHWSLTGDNTPDADSPDEAVYLPGRNALLLVKAAIWCQLHGIPELSLAPLGTSPFPDAGADFLHDFETAINAGASRKVRLLRPFGKLRKRQVMELGRGLPLEHTFSCIRPAGSLHCGACNKCSERQAAFREAEIPDPTPYARRS